MDLYRKDPLLDNLTIANNANASIGYVNQLLGKRRSSDTLRMQRIMNKMRVNRKDYWKNIKQEVDDFVEHFLPPRMDFANYFLPTDDAFSTAGSGTDLSNSFSQYQWLAEKRVGLGPRITWDMAIDAVRNDLFFVDLRNEERIEKPKIKSWIVDTKFYEALARVIYYERVYGIGFLVKYYTENDKELQKMEEPPEKGARPIAFQAFGPMQMAPQDFHVYDKLDKDPQQWDVFGGVRDPQIINRERVEVFMSRPVVNRWYGTSIFEPIWYSIIPYYQALIFLLRGFGKLGNMMTSIEVDEPDDLDVIYEKYGDMWEEQKINGTIIHKIGTKVNFAPTQLATGLKDLIDIWLEDISAGTGVPVPMLVGRVEAAGLGSQAYLTMERKSANAIAKIQESFSPNVRSIIESAGFKLKGIRLDFGLALIKTDAQRYADELAKVEVELAKLQIDATKLQNQSLQLQNEAQEFQNLSTMLGEENGENKPPEQSKFKDFLLELTQKREAIKEKRLNMVKKLHGVRRDV